MACLWEEALRTRIVSSEGLRSAIERRWRGAEGEVSGCEAVDRALCGLYRQCKAREEGRIEGIFTV